MNLPVIDLDSSHRARTASALDAAFCDVGFCYLSNCGVDPLLVNNAFAASRRFHALETAAKAALSINAFHRGYIAPRTSTIRSSSVASVTRPNVSASLMLMHEVDRSDERYGQPLHGPNQWPDGLPGFREAIDAYEQAMARLSHRVIDLVAVALGLGEGALREYFEAPTTWLRLLHYPSQPASDPADLFGAAPHTDYGIITLLAQDQLGGLQVRTRAGQWIDVTPLDNTFVLNVADMLARWTNDRWTSTPHRVRNVSGHDRYSMAYFWDTSTESVIECLPTCTNAQQPPRYPPVRFGDYVIERLERNYAYRNGSV